VLQSYSNKIKSLSKNKKNLERRKYSSVANGKALKERVKVDLLDFSFKFKCMSCFLLLTSNNSKPSLLKVNFDFKFVN